VFGRLEADAGVGRDLTLRDLVRLCAQTINSCAYCVDMHTKDVIANGESVQRIARLGVWRGTYWCTPSERVALVLTEAVTVITDGRVPADIVENTAHYFQPEQLARLIALLVTVNAWNRVGVATRRRQPGSHEPEAVNAEGAALFESGSTNALDVMHQDADDRLAYWVGIQRSVVRLRGLEQPVRMDLRVTEIFRHDHGGRVLIHRHADPLAKNTE
jgi:AhpD family alkylhydroperoxidase